MAEVLRSTPARAPSSRRFSAGLKTPRLSVVIVNYRQWENTARLIRQLKASGCMRGHEAEVVVVDNHSPVHPLLYRLRRWPGVSLRRWGRNRGFARAVNEGCRLSQGEWLLLLNPDMSVTPEFLDGVLGLADALHEAEPRTGVVGLQLRNSDGSRQYSAGMFPTLTGTLAGLARPRARRKYQALTGRERCRVPWVTGCCMLLRRACIQELDGLDESYFLYYEDVDLCRRAHDKGWTVWYEPSLHAIHHAPAHCRRVPPALRLLTRHALLTYSRHHWRRWQCHVLATIIQAESWLRRLWARCCGDVEAAGIFQDMGGLAADVAGGNIRKARRRLNRAIKRIP